MVPRDFGRGMCILAPSSRPAVPWDFTQNILTRIIMRRGINYSTWKGHG